MNRKFFALLFGLTLLFCSQKSASAAPINQLGFIVDKSGSISNGSFNLIKQGIHDGMVNVPVDGTFEVTAVFFGSSITTVVSPTLITSVAVRDMVADAILNYNRTGTGSTLLTGAINTTVNLLAASGNHDPDGNQILNITSDGLPANRTTAAAAATNALAGIIDEIDAESVEAPPSAINFLSNSIVGISPGPPGNGVGTITDPNNLAPGFNLVVDDANLFGPAIAEKIRFVVEPADPVPEPASIAVWTILLLTGAAAVWYRRRKLVPVLN